MGVVGLMIFFLSLSGSSCKKDAPPQLPPKAKAGKSVLVLNEGTFNWGNASLDLIDLETGKLHTNVFTAANQRPLGDVLQSVNVFDQQAWLVVNNSMKIERVSLEDFKSRGTIQPLKAPRYMLPVNQKVYVSDIYAGVIHILDRLTGQKTGAVACKGWTEQMLLIGKEAWVCNVTRSKLYIINTEQDQIIDSVKVGDAPQTIVKDTNGKVWVLCEGALPPAETAGSLWKINPSLRQVEASFQFDEGRHPKNLKIDGVGNTLYYLLNGICRMNIADNNLPSGPWISQGSRLFYGLAVNPADGNIWVSDAKDYVQRGEVLRYDASGKLTGTWLAGIIPRDFHFY